MTRVTDRQGRLAWHLAVLCLLAWSALSLRAQAQEPNTRTLSEFQADSYIVGAASHLTSGELLYTETWDDAPDAAQATIRYWAPDGAAIAYKTLDFADSKFAPSVFQADFRHRRGFEVVRDGSEMTVRKLKLTAGAPLDSAKKGRATTVEYGEKLIVDAGFDRFVLANWARLLSGRSVRFNFLQIDKARLIPLKIKLRKCTAQFEIEVRCFSLNIDNLLLSRFVKPIVLTYELERQRLLRYNGLGQLAGADGKGLVVQIDYRYRD